MLAVAFWKRTFLRQPRPQSQPQGGPIASAVVTTPALSLPALAMYLSRLSILGKRQPNSMVEAEVSALIQTHSEIL